MNETITISRETLTETRKSVSELTCGIYFLFDGEDIVYVGQSTEVELRIQKHRKEGRKKFDSWNFIECPATWLDDMETDCIIHFDPKYNKSLPRNKRFISREGIKKRFGMNWNSAKKMLNKSNVSPCWRNRYWRIDEVRKALT